MRPLGALARWTLSVLARAPGLVALFVVLGTLPALVDPSGGFAVAFGYLHRLLVWYGVAVALVTAAAPEEGFPVRAGRAALRIVGLLPFALALAAGNAAVGWLVRDPGNAAAVAVVPAVVVPVAVAPFGLAPAAVVLDRVGLLAALRTSVAAVTAHRRRAAGLLAVYVGLTAGAVGVQAAGAAAGGPATLALAAAGGFLGTVALAPLAVAVAGFYLEARPAPESAANPAGGT